ncbi:hypothetical protein [Crocosphaera sp. XPORK-15E]|uniref:hypothetical protein n=1 Tax=Crocosphaera sp. XPORK-15E TaxID=3110247 RepID=UPI002B1F1A72|nr:hypothetical protein [Crocosphaera sp. XPORK-15E]MEA5537367.1 hypothetical protein [Crocosphaera sp. XPORK-15E]
MTNSLNFAVLEPLTHSVNQYYQKHSFTNPSLEKEDLLQEAILWAYSHRFFQTNHLSWYGLKQCFQQHLHSLQKQQGCYVSPQSLVLKIKKFTRSFFQQHHRQPTSSEIKQQFHLTDSQFNRIIFQLHREQVPHSLDSDTTEIIDPQNHHDLIFYEQLKRFLLDILSEYELLILNTKYQIFPLQPILSQDTLPKNYRQQLTKILRKIRRHIKAADWLN